MPRVHTRTKAARGAEYRCAKCGEEIAAGEKFYYWTRRFGRGGITYRQHHSCGYPRPTQLSSRKTARIEETRSGLTLALEMTVPDDLTWDSEHLRSMGGGGSFDIDTDPLDMEMSELADEAESVADEYEESFQNIPDSLQQGPSAQAMEEVANELRDWAERLRDYASSLDPNVEVPDPSDFETEDEWMDALQTALDAKLEEYNSAASDVADEMPEYQG